MLQNPYKTLGFKKNMVYKISTGGGGGGKPYPASGLHAIFILIDPAIIFTQTIQCIVLSYVRPRQLNNFISRYFEEICHALNLKCLR